MNSIIGLFARSTCSLRLSLRKAPNGMRFFFSLSLFLKAHIDAIEKDVEDVAAVLSTPICAGCAQSGPLHRNTRRMKIDLAVHLTYAADVS